MCVAERGLPVRGGRRVARVCRPRRRRGGQGRVRPTRHRAGDPPASRARCAFDPARRASIDARQPAAPDSREFEVLRLIAGGLSNDQIAARLFLSHRTGHDHVAAVLGKFGVNRRAAARCGICESGDRSRNSALPGKLGSRCRCRRLQLRPGYQRGQRPLADDRSEESSDAHRRHDLATPHHRGGSR